jgi:anti-anti-sigma factor
MKPNLTGPGPAAEAAMDGTLVHFAGRQVSLDEEVVLHVRDQLAAIAEEPGDSALLIDFGNVQFVSSAALGTLLKLDRQLLGAGRRLVVCNLPAPLREVFAVSRLDRIVGRAAPDPGPAPESGGAQDTHPGGVLVVDDEPAVLFVLEAGLRHAGFEVWSAPDGRQAVELYRSRPGAIAVVLLDVRMPGMDGPRTLGALRGVCPAVRCCFMTGNPEPYTEEGLLQMGALQVFRKPVALEDVAGTLRHVAGRSARRWRERWVEMPCRGV